MTADRPSLMACPSREAALDAVAKLHLMPCMNATDDLKQSEYCILLRKFINAATPPLPAGFVAVPRDELLSLERDEILPPDGDNPAPYHYARGWNACLDKVRALAVVPCQTCNGAGMIGGWAGQTAESGGYESEPCPECSPPPPAVPVAEGREARLLELAEILSDGATKTDSGLDVTVLECIDVMQAAAAELRTLATHPAEASAQGGEAYTYCSEQATNCAECGEHRHTPLRIDAMGGYVCLTCIDRKLSSLLGEFGAPPAAPERAEPKGASAVLYVVAKELAVAKAQGGMLLVGSSEPEPTRQTPLYEAPPACDELVARLEGLAAKWVDFSELPTSEDHTWNIERSAAYETCADELRAALAGVKA